MSRTKNKYQRHADQIVRIGRQDVGVPEKVASIALVSGAEKNQRRGLIAFIKFRESRNQSLGHWPVEEKLRYGYRVTQR